MLINIVSQILLKSIKRLFLGFCSAIVTTTCIDIYFDKLFKHQLDIDLLKKM